MRLVCALPILIATLASSLTAAEPSASQWPQFRGPLGTGVVAGAKAPVNWDSKSVRWAADLPSQGHSSPVVWGDRIYLTGATRGGGKIQRHVMCLNRKDGAVLWTQVANTGEGEALHKMNSWATPSCAVDGERVVAFFGVGGLHCYDMDGKSLWSRDFGDFPGSWGVGASPIIVGDLVIQNCDCAGPSFLVALDKATGRQIWKTDRRPKPRGGWSTPVLVDTGAGKQLILNGEERVASYDPQTGRELWFCSSFNGRGTPAPVWGNGIAYVVNGKSGDVYAVKPDGKGDVTDSRMVWHTERRGGRDLPSPVLCGSTLVVFSMSGIATGYSAVDGAEQWKQRVGGNFSGSPVVAGDLVYAAAESGDVIVLKPSDGGKIVARNSVGISDNEIVRSSLAILDGTVYLRSDRKLYSIR